MNYLAILLIRLLFFLVLVFLFFPPHDGLGLVLFTTQVVSVRQTGSPHHFSVNTSGIPSKKKQLEK